jgi:uncharacterized protein YggE
MRYVVVAVFCLFVVRPLSGQIPEIQPAFPEISVVGRGDVLVSADRARLSVTIETHDQTAVRAASDNAEATARTIAALKSAGAAEQDIKTSGYTVWMDYDSNGRRIKGFGARNSLRVEVPRIADLGRLVDAALSGGATQLQPVQFLGPKIDQARHDAMVAAVARARADAQILAEAAGGTLGDLISLTSTSGTPGSYERNFNLDAVVLSGAVAPTNFSPSDLVVSATAAGKWRFLSRKQ